MATRVAYVAMRRARTPVLRMSSSLQTPRCRPVLHIGNYRRWAPLSSSASSRISTTATVRENNKPSAAPEQHSSPTAPDSLPGATAQSSDAVSSPSATTQGSSTKPLPRGETVSGSSIGVSTDPPNGGDSDGRTSSGRSRGRGGGGSGGGSAPRGPLTWGAVVLLGIVGTLAVGYYKMQWEEKQNRVASDVTTTGKPALGGPFTLVDMHGRPVTDKDFHGSFVLLYFGFCFCPDICPSELVKVGAIARKLEATLGGGVVKPVFVSVDPDRDSLDQLKHYAQDFHPSIEYLTGTKEQVAKAAKAYRVYFSKTEEHDEGEDYLVDHSIVIYLLAPNGEFLDFFTQRTTIADCVDRMTKHVKGFKPATS